MLQPLCNPTPTEEGSKGRPRSCPRDESPASHVGEAAVAGDDPKAASAVGEAAVAVDGAGAASAIREAAVAVDCAGAASVVKEAAVAADGGGAASESRDSAVAADGGGCAASKVVDAAVAVAMYRERHRLTSHEGCPTDPSAWTFSSDSASDTETLRSVTTFQPGDSVFGDESVVDAEEAGGQKDAAVANETKGGERKPRNIMPAQHDLKSKWEERNNADHIGNMGWLFGNWGKRPKNDDMRNHLDLVLKKLPAMVIGFAECQEETEKVLKREPSAVAGTATPGVCGFYLRPECPYLTLRGKGEDSVLITVRDHPGSALQLLDLYRLNHGSTKRRNSTNGLKAVAYSRAIVAKVTLPHNVRFLGREHVVMVVHMRNEFAGNRGEGRSKSFGTNCSTRSVRSRCRS